MPKKLIKKSKSSLKNIQQLDATAEISVAVSSTDAGLVTATSRKYGKHSSKQYATNGSPAQTVGVKPKHKRRRPPPPPFVELFIGAKENDSSDSFNDFLNRKVCC